MNKLSTIVASLLLSSCVHNEYSYNGMIGKDYVRFEIIKETVPGKFKDLPGRVKEKEYVPFYNLMTIITSEVTVQMYDIDNDLKPDYLASSKGISPIETLNPKLQDFVLSQWNNNLDTIKNK